MALISIEQAHAAVVATAARAGAILDDAIQQAPRIAEAVAPAERAVIDRGRVPLTSGIPRFSWNGLDEGGRLFPGLHPASRGEAELRFAWNPERRRMFERMVEDLAELRREHPNVNHVIGAGSFFGTDKVRPGDIDLAVLGVSDAQALASFTKYHAITHVYPAEGRSAGIPKNMLRFFATDRADAERGMVLLSLDDLLGSGATNVA